MLTKIEKTVRDASPGRESAVYALSVIAVVFVAAVLDPIFLLGFLGIFAGDGARALVAAWRSFRAARAADAQRSAAPLAARLAAAAQGVAQVLTASGQLSQAILQPLRAALHAALRIREGLSGLVHVSLASRLLPAPFAAR